MKSYDILEKAILSLPRGPETVGSFLGIKIMFEIGLIDCIPVVVTYNFTFGSMKTVFVKSINYKGELDTTAIFSNITEKTAKKIKTLKP